jgi:hypothetical protein
MAHKLVGQAGLFSAVQSAFAVAIYPSLQTSSPKVPDVTANVFVFCSLSLSLSCAFGGILRKDQLKRYISWTSKRTDARSQVVDRQFRFEINSRRRLWDSAKDLSAGLVLSISLFTVGIFVLLFALHWFVALAVCLFSCITLCVIFGGDIHYYYLHCRRWFRAVQYKLEAWERQFGMGRITLDEVNAGLLPSDDDHFGLLARAVMSRTPESIPPDNLPNIARHHVRAILGLGGLHSRGYYRWRVLKPPSGAETGYLALLGAVDLVLAILQDRGPLKTQSTTVGPLPRRSGLKKLFTHFTGQIEYDPESLTLELDSELSSGNPWRTAEVAARPWLTWIMTVLAHLSAEETMLLADVIAASLRYTLHAAHDLPIGLRRDDVDRRRTSITSADYLARALAIRYSCERTWKNVVQINELRIPAMPHEADEDSRDTDAQRLTQRDTSVRSSVAADPSPAINLCGREMHNVQHLDDGGAEHVVTRSSSFLGGNVIKQADAGLTGPPLTLMERGFPAGVNVDESWSVTAHSQPGQETITIIEHSEQIALEMRPTGQALLRHTLSTPGPAHELDSASNALTELHYDHGPPSTGMAEQTQPVSFPEGESTRASVITSHAVAPDFGPSSISANDAPFARQQLTQLNGKSSLMGGSSHLYGHGDSAEETEQRAQTLETKGKEVAMSEGKRWRHDWAGNNHDY